MNVVYAAHFGMAPGAWPLLTPKPLSQPSYFTPLVYGAVCI